MKLQLREMDTVQYKGKRYQVSHVNPKGTHVTLDNYDNNGNTETEMKLYHMDVSQLEREGAKLVW